MPLPGHTVTIGERAAASRAPSSTSNGFMVGFTERGPHDEPVLVTSLTEAIEKLGEKVNFGAIYDALDVAFREGAPAIYVAREVGPSPLAATHTYAASAGNALKATAISVGAWGNDISLAITASGGNFTIALSYQGDLVVTSPTLATSAAAVAWAADDPLASSYIVLEDEGGGDPVTATASLSTGTDDHSNATAQTFQDALDLFAKDLGPGQIAAPGFTTSAVYTALLAHAAANNRRALLDGADTANESTLTAASIALRGQTLHAERFGGMFAPWAIVPGESPGTTRTVPYSAVQMGLIARADAETGDPNKAAAGKRGRARYATGLTQSYTDAQREALNDAGVDVAVLIRGVVTTYGNRTLADPSSDGDWKWLSASRTVMGVAALADLVLEDYDFEQIDAKSHVFSALQGDLSGRACMPFYLADALYGQTPNEAFVVNTGPDVNTPTTISNGEIHAQIGIRVSESGEVLTVEIVKVPTTEVI